MEQQSSGLRKGFWEELPVVKEEDRKPKISFELGVPVIVTFQGEPREWDSTHGDGVFYVFDVTVRGEPKVIMTGSKTLLYGVKSLGNLEGATAKITKVMKPWSDGMTRQFFEVERVAPEDVVNYTRVE